MKKSPETLYAPSMELETPNRSFTRLTSRKKTQPAFEKIVITVPQPSEELIAHLNQLGQQYPFCIYYKQKDYDPL